MKSKIVCVILLSLIYGSNLFAQKTVIRQNLFWYRYYNQLEINSKIVWHNEVEGRRFFEGYQRHHFIMHSRLHYKLTNNTDMAGGMTYSRQSPQNPNPRAIDVLVVPEFRFVQEFNHNIPVSSRFSFQERLRIEQRFFRKNNGVELLEGHSFNFRFRLRLQASYRLNKELTKKTTILKVSNEVMINAGKNILLNKFDQNRIYIGIERELSKKVSVELGYMNWYQQTSLGYLFYNRNIVRLTLYHRIKYNTD